MPNFIIDLSKPIKKIVIFSNKELRCKIRRNSWLILIQKKIFFLVYLLFFILLYNPFSFYNFNFLLKVHLLNLLIPKLER
jgi:hypothetical protein